MAAPSSLFNPMFGDEFFADFPFPFGGFGTGSTPGGGGRRALQNRNVSRDERQDVRGNDAMMVQSDEFFFRPDSMFKGIEDLMRQTATMGTTYAAAPGNAGDNNTLATRDGGVFQSQVMVMSSSMGADGQVHTRRYAHSDRGDLSHGVREVHEAFDDTEAAEQRAMHYRQVKDRAHRVQRKRDKRTGHEDSVDEVRGFERDHLDGFNHEWNTQAVPRLPEGASTFSQQQLMGGSNNARALPPPQALEVGTQPYAGQRTPYVMEEVGPGRSSMAGTKWASLSRQMSNQPQSYIGGGATYPARSHVAPPTYTTGQFYPTQQQQSLYHPQQLQHHSPQQPQQHQQHQQPHQQQPHQQQQQPPYRPAPLRSSSVQGRRAMTPGGFQTTPPQAYHSNQSRQQHH